MNIVVITLDDVNLFTLGFMDLLNCKTPNIDILSKDSFVFYNAHCNIPFCQPSRMVLLTGLYPQNNGSMQFNPIKKNVKTLSSILKKNGYFTCLLGKTYHHRPENQFNWDEIVCTPTCFQKNPEERKKSIEILKNAQKSSPYFALINLRCTHRPFSNESGIYDGVWPNFLPDNKIFRKNFFGYMNSLRQADETVGDILSILDNDTLVVLTSDHGCSFPYLKGSCYGFSTNVPMIFRHKTLKPKKDVENVISHVDFVPTILDFLKIKFDSDGVSYLDVLQEKKSNKDFKYAYVQLNKMLRGPRCRTRAVTEKNFSYVVNFDLNFEAQNIDNFGNLLKYIKKDYFLRSREELVEYNKIESKKSKNYEKKIELRKILFKKMSDFNDTIKLFKLL